MILARVLTQEHNTCVAIVIHDLNLAIRYCDRFIFLKNSQVYSYGSMETMTPENIEDVYKIHVHIIEHIGIPVIIPFPYEPVSADGNKEKAVETANEA